MRSLESHLRLRMQTANTVVSEALEEIRWRINNVGTLAISSEHFAHVLYICVSAHDKYQLEEELFKYGYREWYGEREFADKLIAEADPIIESVACELFLRWSWADAVLRHVVAALVNFNSKSAEYRDQIIASIEESLSTRLDEVLPGDRRRHRVLELLNDELNDNFFAAIRSNPSELGANLDMIDSSSTTPG